MVGFDKMMEELDEILSVSNTETDEDHTSMDESFLPVPDGYNLKLFKSGGKWSWSVYFGDKLEDKGTEDKFEKALKMLMSVLVSSEFGK